MTDMAAQVRVSGNLKAEDHSAARAAIVDSVFVVVLCTLGLYGFHTLYGGWQYLAIGVVGSVLGAVISQLTMHWRKTVLAEVVLAIVVFVVVGGALVARSSAIGGVVPSGGSMSQLWHVLIQGWKQLLTTAPPVGDSSDLLAIPYVVGLVGAVAGTSLAGRTRSPLLPLLGPGFVLAIGILFGSAIPTALFLQGAVFGALSLTWVAVRHHRTRPGTFTSTFGRRRAVVAIGVLAVVTLIASWLGPLLPGADSHQRVVLSRYIVPPFDVNAQPSPLAGFRQYAQGGGLDHKVLFTVRTMGGPMPAHVRIATMDEYDGIVWGFGVSASGSSSTQGSDSFEKFGTTIPTSQSGTQQMVEVTVGALSGIWMPGFGQASRITFNGTDAASLDENLRFDTDTEAAAQPAELKTGESYSIQSVVPPAPSLQELEVAPPGVVQVAISNVPEVVRTDAEQWEGSATSAWGRVTSIATHLRQVGKYSNGSTGASSAATLSLPGHSAGRLTTFFDGGGLVGTQIVGDDEQYAAAMALMANAVDVPARVVLGADVPSDGQVVGSDVHAWIEVDLQGLGWVPMYQTAFMSNDPPAQTPPTQKPQAQSSSPIQPPSQSAVRTPFQDQLPGVNDTSTAPTVNVSGPLLPAWLVSILRWLVPLLVIVGLFVGVVLGLKRRRRRSRFRADRPSTRIAGAWAELVDHCRDLGRSVPALATRQEQAPHLDAEGADALAWRADSAVFGPAEPTVEEIEAYWRSVDEAVASARTRLTRFERVKAALSLRSLRPMSPTLEA
jgi:hypothetical protein